MHPQSFRSGRMGAPGTFSITQEAAWPDSHSRVGVSRSGCADGQPCILVALLNAWHGGEAWTASNPSSGNVVAAAWTNSNGERGCGLVATPTTSTPARW